MTNRPKKDLEEELKVLKSKQEILISEITRLVSIVNKFSALAYQFIEKVDSGRAHSIETYNTLKGILYELEEIQNNNASGY